jgi:DNA-binding response OmpR family regulator
MARILVIEEDAAMRALVHEWLESAGYQVDCCDAPRIPFAHAPRLIIASLMNLRGPGATQLQQLRSSFPDLAVVVLCGQLGHSLWHDSETAKSLGVSALIAKPFARSELLAAVLEALRHAPR